MYITKAHLMEDHRTLCSALKKAGYSPEKIIKEYREEYGEREIAARGLDTLTEKGLAIMQRYSKISNKALGLER